MKTILAADRPLVPASHEDPKSPGAWKRVLLQKSDFPAGALQMINWATLPPGKSFAPHYHEDMQEIFVIVRGEARIVVGPAEATLGTGDAVVIDPREVHEMTNIGAGDLDYLAIGISLGQGGRTVVVKMQNENCKM